MLGLLALIEKLEDKYGFRRIALNHELGWFDEIRRALIAVQVEGSLNLHAVTKRVIVQCLAAPVRYGTN
jgi:hypothetical protein